MRRFLAQPWDIVEKYFRENNISYEVRIARGAKSFFKVYDTKSYVAQIKEPLVTGGVFWITLVMPPMPHESLSEFIKD